MLAEHQSRLVKIKFMQEQATYMNKFRTEFSVEMRRSVKEILKTWLN